MKKLALIILAVALAGAAANADTHYLCFSRFNSLCFAKIPGPGDHYTLNIVHTIPIGFGSDALTYDGTNWWIYRHSTGEVYCFDQNGEYVRSFPPDGNGLDGLAWDGNYLWLSDYVPGENINTYSKDIYGNDGPYARFKTYRHALTVVGDKLLCGDYGEQEFSDADIMVWDFYGNFLFYGASFCGYYDSEINALAYHDGIVWASGWYDGEYETYHETVGYYYDDYGDWDEYATIHDYSVYDLTVCDADFINIAESSLGNIKAYFATEEMKGK